MAGRFAINAVKNTRVSQALSLDHLSFFYAELWSSWKYMVKKEEDVPAGSCQHTVRPLSREYASVTQKLCRDEHGEEKGISTPGPVSSVFLCYQLTSSRHAWAKQGLVVTSGS